MYQEGTRTDAGVYGGCGLMRIVHGPGEIGERRMVDSPVCLDLERRMVREVILMK